MLTIEGSPDGSVTLAGRLDAVQAPQAQAAFDRLGGRVVVDCTALDYISSAGLGILLAAQKRLSAKGQSLRLINVNSHIRDVFHFSGFDQIFDIA